MKTRKNQSEVTLFDIFIVIAIVMILVVMIDKGSGGCANISHGTGQKIGQVVKLSKQGFIRDTWEGQLIRGGFSNGSGSLGTQPFNFTVEGEDLAKSVQELMKNQTEVVIEYRIEGLYSPLRTESHGHFLLGIKPAKP